MTECDEDSIPLHTLESSGRVWAHGKLDPQTHQWTYPLDQEEFDWDVSSASPVGTDVPVRVVNLEFHDEWMVQGLEVAGPDYHRPGFTETISSDYISYTASSEEAIEMIEDLVERLS